MKYGVYAQVTDNDETKEKLIKEFETKMESDEWCDKMNFRWQTCAYYTKEVK